MTEKIFIRDVSEDIWRLAKATAAMRKMKMGEVINDALRIWLGLEQVKDADSIKWDSMIGLGESGLKDVSEKHDFYLSKTDKTK